MSVLALRTTDLSSSGCLFAHATDPVRALGWRHVSFSSPLHGVVLACVSTMHACCCCVGTAQVLPGLSQLFNGPSGPFSVQLLMAPVQAEAAEAGSDPTAAPAKAMQANGAVKADPTKFSGKKSKATAKKGGAKSQYATMLLNDIPEGDIAAFRHALPSAGLHGA